MSESCLAILAIRLDSLPGSRAPLLSTWPGSVSGSASATWRAASYMRDVTIDCISPSIRVTRFASSRDMGRIRARRNSPRTALIRSMALPPDPRRVA